MNTYIVTEGQSDATLIRKVLEPKVETPLVFVPAGGKSSVMSMARSLMVTKRQPIAVIVDSDSLDETRVREQEHIFFDILNSSAAGVAFRLYLAVPEIEQVFFEFPTVIEAELKVQLNDMDRQEASARPSAVLKRLLATRHVVNGKEEFFVNLSSQATKGLAQAPLFKALVAFIRRPIGAGSWSNLPALGVSGSADDSRGTNRRPRKTA